MIISRDAWHGRAACSIKKHAPGSSGSMQGFKGIFPGADGAVLPAMRNTCEVNNKYERKCTLSATNKDRAKDMDAHGCPVYSLGGQ